VNGFTIEKRILMPHAQNTVHVTYTVLEGQGTVRFNLRPSVQYRGYETPVDQPLVQIYTIAATGGRYELSAGTEMPVLRMMLYGERAALTLDEKGQLGPVQDGGGPRLSVDSGRCGVRGTSAPTRRAGESISLVASAEPWDTVVALQPADAAAAERDRRRRPGLDRQRPRRGHIRRRARARRGPVHHQARGAREEAARARASGDEVRTVIAGYPLVHRTGAATR
jgi:hypothetical protein